MRLVVSILLIYGILGFNTNSFCATVNGKSGLLQVGNTEIVPKNGFDAAFHIFYRDLEEDNSNFSVPFTFTYGLIEDMEIGLAVPAQFGDEGEGSTRAVLLRRPVYRTHPNSGSGIGDRFRRKWASL